MARRNSNDDIPDLIHVLTVASSVEIATGASISERQVREKLRGDNEIYEDWEGSPGVLKSTARRVRAEMIAEIKARQLAGIVANAEVDRANRRAREESAAAGRRQRESQYLGPRVSAPGATPEPWMDTPSEGDDS